jgi:hypothetical protein
MVAGGTLSPRVEGRPNGPTLGALKKRDRRPARCGRRTVANYEDTREQRQDFSLQN